MRYYPRYACTSKLSDVCIYNLYSSLYLIRVYWNITSLYKSLSKSNLSSQRYLIKEVAYHNISTQVILFKFALRDKLWSYIWYILKLVISIKKKKNLSSQIFWNAKRLKFTRRFLQSIENDSKDDETKLKTTLSIFRFFFRTFLVVLKIRQNSQRINLFWSNRGRKRGSNDDRTAFKRKW